MYQPHNWKDFRLNVQLSSYSDGAIGIYFRYQDQNNYYRFEVNRGLRYRRWIKVYQGNITVLAEDDFVIQKGRSYVFTVDIVEDTIRIYQDGAVVFEGIDKDIKEGTIGLYCWNNDKAVFSDIRLDDLHKSTPVAYKFKFVTSNFANFYHHLHSFQDETWLYRPTDSVDISGLIKNALDSKTSSTTNALDAEFRAYNLLLNKIFGFRLNNQYDNWEL